MALLISPSKPSLPTLPLDNYFIFFFCFPILFLFSENKRSQLHVYYAAWGCVPQLTSDLFIFFQAHLFMFPILNTLHCSVFRFIIFFCCKFSLLLISLCVFFISVYFSSVDIYFSIYFMSIFNMISLYLLSIWNV